MSTTNKNLNLPAYNSTNWDVPLNANFTSIDNAFGGHTLKNPTSITGTVVLTASEYSPPLLLISSGLPPASATTLSGNINYQIPSGVGGFWFVYNNTTNSSGNSYTVTISSGGGGSSVGLREGVTTAIICDGTNVGFADTNPIYASGSNTQLQYNNSGVLGANSNLTWNTYSATFTGTIAAAVTFTGTIASGTNTLVTTGVSGTIQTGMTLGTITGGTFTSPTTVTILSQLSGTTGGAGSYAISQVNTGAAATVASAGTNTLVVTGTTGTIRLGMTLGTITGGTFASPTTVTILSQLSGTTGGDGSYVLSQGNTGGAGATVGSASFSALASPNLIGNVTGNASTATSAATASFATAASTATSATSATTATYASTVTGTALAIGYLQIPQSTNTTAAASDVGKHIYVSSSVTINSGIFSAGDSFVIVNSNTATTSISIIAGSGVTLRLAGTTTSGTPRTIAPNGMASVLCVASNTFLISGAGVS
jgi:hypothetical protein